MSVNRKFSGSTQVKQVVALALFVVAALPGTMKSALAQSAADGYQPKIERSASGVEYASGGVGLDESQYFQQAGREWPATLQFASKAGPKGEYVADVKVTVQPTGKTEPVLDQATSHGPYMLLRLQPGAYEVTARFAGHTLKQRLQVVQGQPTRLLFLWPQGAGGGGLEAGPGSGGAPTGADPATPRSRAQ